MAAPSQQLPVGWQMNTLGTLCDVLDKQRKPITKKNRVAGEYPYYGATGILDYVKDFIFDEKLILIGEDGAKWGAGENTAFTAEGKYWVNNHAHVIRPHRDVVLDNWIIYYLNGNDQAPFITGLTVPKLNQGKLKEIPVPTPPIAEQKRIVAILDEAFAGIAQAVANAEKNLANARELFESYLNKVFTEKGEGWTDKMLSDVCSIKHGFAFKSQFFSTDGDYIVLTPGSFYENGGFRDQGKKTKYYLGEIPDGYILNKGDFLLAMTEQAAGLLGSSLIVPQSNFFLHNQRLGLVQISDDMSWDGDFFHHQFNTKSFRDAVQTTASGVKVRHTSPTKLGAISITFPPEISEQKEIASVLNKMKSQTQHLETIYQKKLTALYELKQSILQKAFTGELTAEKGTIKEKAIA